MAVRTRRVTTSATPVAMAPAGKSSDPPTRALAARTHPRHGPAAKVVRISPRLYSQVANKVASTITNSSAAIVRLTMLAPAHWAERMSPTSGAMSPDPLMVNAPAGGCCQVEADGTEG